MTDPNRPTGARPALIALGGALGTSIAIYSDITPLTGVTGTFGAGLVIASSLAIFLASIVIQMPIAPGLRALLRVLVVLGILGTAAAGYFLHEWGLIAAMGVAAVGVIVDLAAPKTQGALV